MVRQSGVATIFARHDQTAAGLMPTPVWDVPKAQSYYAGKKVGINRYWSARGNNDQIDLLIEIDRCADVTTADRVFLEPFTREHIRGWYRIVQIQHDVDDDQLLVTDLSLERIQGLTPNGGESIDY